MRPEQTVSSLASAVAVAVLTCGGCKVAEGPPEDEIFDVPLEGLTPAQTDVHIAGDEQFGKTFTPQEGLGPIFNATSCDACHPGEAKGHPTFRLIRFGRYENGSFSTMSDVGGPQLQDRSIPGYPPEEVPDEATGVAKLSPPVVTGLGFVDAVDDSTLLELADPNDEDGDGISGRVQFIDATDSIGSIVEISEIAGEGGPDRFERHDGKFIGRFGWKARAVNLRHQTVFAYAEDMGLTTRFNPEDLQNVQDVGPASQDEVPDPEIATSTVSNVVFYLKTLRPPQRRNADDPEVRAGEQIFADIGCTECHHPEMQTGDSKIPQLSNTTFHPYSDFLLHDMGPELDDGYTEGRAESSEWRTPPLWGLGLADDFQGGTPHLLHDGRARSIPEAIEFHGGEASGARDAFRNLSSTKRSQLLAFLESL